jgi:hypothetical protein
VKLSTALLACLMLKFASACAPLPPVETRTGACDVFSPIYPTAEDAEVISDDLGRQLIAHDDKGRALGCWS